MSSFSAIPKEQPCGICTGRRTMSIGLPSNSNEGERRFPLTPEAVAILVDKGMRVVMQTGAADPIHYTDSDYMRAGAEVAGRSEALRCDIVASLPALSVSDIHGMRKGAMLFTLYGSYAGNADTLRALTDQSVIALALDMVKCDDGHMPFADILQEIDGRASIAVASALQSDPVSGKGILMGGIAGIVPCEITILGSGISACSAARSAVGLGAMVRMFDNDVYRLRSAMQHLGASVIGSAMHPHVLEGAFRSADVIIATPMRHPVTVGTDLVSVMKRRVIVIDVTGGGGKVFPSLPTVDLGLVSSIDDSAGRKCLFNVSGRVPRTAAMAVSNALIAMFDDILSGTGSGTDSGADIVRMLPGIQAAVFAFLGKIVNAQMASSVGMRCADLSLYMSLS